MADPLDAYKTLQVDPEADPEVIQAAYRRLARKYHPDVVAGPEAAVKMVAINRAWALLEDPDSRAAYDRERADRAAREKRRTTGRAVGRPDEAEATRSVHPQAGAAPRRSAPRDAEPPLPGEGVSRDWSSGRSTVGAFTTRRRCARGRVSVRPGRRPATPPARSSTSGDMPAGRSEKSDGATSNTSSGSTECRSADRTATRSTRSCAVPGAVTRRLQIQLRGEACSGAAEASTSSAGMRRRTTRSAVAPWANSVKSTTPNTRTGVPSIMPDCPATESGVSVQG